MIQQKLLKSFANKHKSSQAASSPTHSSTLLTQQMGSKLTTLTGDLPEIGSARAHITSL